MVRLIFHGAWALTILGVGYCLYPHLAERWFRAGSYFEHGPAVATAALLWAFWLLRRHSPGPCPVDIPGATPATGTALLFGFLGGLALWLLAARDVGFAGVLGICLALMAWIVVLAGLTGLKGLSGPLGLLCFAFPWPLKLVEDLTLPLKSLALEGAMLLAPQGVVRIGEGALLDLGEQGMMVVGDVCSGLRGLLAMLALSWVVASMARSLWQGCVVLLLSVPLTLGCNVLRIVTLIFIGKHWSAADAGPESWVHDAVGIAVWVLTLIGLWLLLALCGGLARQRAEVDYLQAFRSPVRALGWAVWGLVSLPFCVVLALGAMGGASERVHLGSEVFAGVPAVLSEPGSVGGLTIPSRDVPLDARSLELLMPDASLSRLYGEAGSYHLVMVVGRGAKTRLHPPEICYRGSGFEVLSKQRYSLEGSGAHSPPQVVALRLRRGEELRLTWYWYQLGTQWTASYARFFWAGLWSPGATQGLNWLSIPVERRGEPGSRDYKGDWQIAERRLHWFLSALAPYLDEARLQSGRD